MCRGRGTGRVQGRDQDDRAAVLARALDDVCRDAWATVLADPPATPTGSHVGPQGPASPPGAVRHGGTP